MSLSTLQLYSTPLHVATRTGHAAIVEYLLSCGVKMNSRDRVYRRQLNCVSFHFLFLHHLHNIILSLIHLFPLSQEGDTALHDAVRLNRYKIVKLLIFAGADTQIKNHVSVSPCTLV